VNVLSQGQQENEKRKNSDQKSLHDTPTRGYFLLHVVFQSKRSRRRPRSLTSGFFTNASPKKIGGVGETPSPEDFRQKQSEKNRHRRRMLAVGFHLNSWPLPRLDSTDTRTGKPWRHPQQIVKFLRRFGGQSHRLSG
jgi:hypothetical protein